MNKTMLPSSESLTLCIDGLALRDMSMNVIALMAFTSRAVRMPCPDVKWPMTWYLLLLPYQVFIDSKYKNGRSTTEEECAGLLIAALFGGQHTSSLTSTWMAPYLLT